MSVRTDRLKAFPHLGTGLFALTVLVAAACTPTETVRISPSPTAAAATSAPVTTTPTPRPSTAPPASPSASPSPTTRPSASPGSTPPVACAPQAGGSDANRVLLTAVRIAHNPGFDRIVFEFGPTDRGVGGYGIPPFTIEVASSFAGPSGIPVTIDGNAHFRVRFQNTDAHTNAGVPTLASQDLRPTTPLLKEAKLVEDFEATVVWGLGLDHLVCPSVLTLGGPARVVFDFPTPP